MLGYISSLMWSVSERATNTIGENILQYQGTVGVQSDRQRAQSQVLTSMQLRAHSRWAAVLQHRQVIRNFCESITINLLAARFAALLARVRVKEAAARANVVT